MAVLVTTMCHECDTKYPDQWSDEANKVCCGERTRWCPTALHTTEWGGPRHIPTLRDEAFSSRSELASYTKSKGLSLGAPSEKIGGARNESHLNLGVKYSYTGSPKS